MTQTRWPAPANVAATAVGEPETRHPPDALAPTRQQTMTDPAGRPDEHLVVFTPSGLRGLVHGGTSVLDAARRLGVDLDSVCGGRGICGRCQVMPTFGEFAKHGITANPNHVSDRGPTEADYRGGGPWPMAGA